jgi:mono/diheme cytochrome c family protein
MRSAAVVLFAAACGTQPSAPKVAFSYPPIPADPQRAGDPTKGYDTLVNGGYITCGIPKSIYDAAFPPAAASLRIPGRTGDNATLPYYYSAATSSEGVRVVSANCLTCHAGSINGQLVVGLGAADRDFTTDASTQIDLVGQYITDPTEHAEWQRFDDRMKAIAPYTQTKVVGTNPADNLTAILMAHRDPTTLAWSETPMIDLPPATPVPVDVPPWWRMSRKHAMFYSAAGRGDHARIMMAASLLCTDSVAEAQAIDATFVDVRAWIETLTPPAWPFAIDHGLADRGRTVFDATCARCHGTYEQGGSYPNELVPLGDVGTDPLLAMGAAQFGDAYVQWFASSFWGQTSRLAPQNGYVAPPLDGIWATAPFFHNGSVPTLAGVIDSSQRPASWTRTFQSTDYDQAAVGWKFTTPAPQAGNSYIYDTSQPGYGNGGHVYGDALSTADRAALLEYLKTL